MGIKAPYPLRVPMIQGSVGFGLGGLERLLKGFYGFVVGLMEIL